MELGLHLKDASLKKHTRWPSWVVSGQDLHVLSPLLNASLAKCSKADFGAHWYKHHFALFFAPIFSLRNFLSGK